MFSGGARIKDTGNMKREDIEAWIIFIGTILFAMLVFYFAIRLGFGNIEKWQNLFDNVGINIRPP